MGCDMVLSTEQAHCVDVKHVMQLWVQQQQRAWDSLSVCPRTCP